MNFKFWYRVMGFTFVLIIISSIFLNMMESNGMINEDSLSYSGVSLIQVYFFVLFLIMGFTAFPVFIRLFILGQKKIGNGELPAIKWLQIQANEKKVVFIIWIFLVLGLCISMQGSFQDGSFK
jgi:hypothetical protein